MKRLQPFISYFGSKWRLAPRYPLPSNARIVEPFAGAASYSLLHYERDIHINDANPNVAAVWDFLTRATPAEIQSLPLDFDSTDDIKACEEARLFVGFWTRPGTCFPSKTKSKWLGSSDNFISGSMWSEKVRERVASQVEKIRHWKITCLDVFDIPLVKATYFVDPPYVDAGRAYPKQVGNYERLATWCQDLPGQTIVCEAQGANWLPFRPFAETITTAGKQRKRPTKYTEVVWTKD